MNPYSSQQLLDDEDELAMQLRGVDPDSVETLPEPTDAVDPAASVEDVAPSALEQVDPPAAPMPAVEPAKSPLESFKAALLEKFAPQGTAASPQVGPDAKARTSAALYAAFTHGKVPDWAFGNQATSKAADPLAAFRAEMLAKRFGFDQDKEAWDRSMDQRKQDEKERQNNVIESLKTRGVITAEQAQALREAYADKNYALQERKVTNQEKATNATQGRFSNTSLQKYGDKIAADVPMVALLKDIENQSPGLITGDVRELLKVTGGKNPLADPAASEEDVLGFLARLKEMAPKGLGSRMESTKAARIRSAIAQLENMVTHDLFGASLTKVEADKAKRVFRSGLLDSPEAQAAVLDMFRQMIREKLKSREAAVRPGIDLTEGLWDQYTQGGGISSEDPIFQMPSNITPQMSERPLDIAKDIATEVKGFVAPKAKKVMGGGKVKVSDGKQSFMVDEADVAEAEKDGFRRVK